MQDILYILDYYQVDKRSIVIKKVENKITVNKVVIYWDNKYNTWNPKVPLTEHLLWCMPCV